MANDVFGLYFVISEARNYSELRNLRISFNIKPIEVGFASVAKIGFITNEFQMIDLCV